MSAFLSLFVALSMTLKHSLGLKEVRCRSLFKRFLDTRILLVMRMRKASARIRSLDAVVNIKMTTFNKLQAEHTATSSSYDNAINTANELAKSNEKKLGAAETLSGANHDKYVAANDLANVNHEKYIAEQTSRTTDKQIVDTRYMELEQSKDPANELAEVNYTRYKAAYDKLRKSNATVSTSVNEANNSTVKTKLTCASFVRRGLLAHSQLL